MATYHINIRLLSETTFGRGDGLAGEVDQEIVHDTSGFPYLRGRTLKGMLSEECDGIVAMLPQKQRWGTALRRLFGSAGSTTSTQARWHYGDATLPLALRRAVAQQFKATDSRARLTATDVLDSLTTIRQQTAIHATSGTPDEGSLRAARVIIRTMTFTSSLTTDSTELDDLVLLAAGCRALRHIGSGRTRGRGHVRCTLADSQGIDITSAQLAALEGVETVKTIVLQLTAVQPLLLTSLQGDPNSSVSFPYIPGSVLRGALIGRYSADKQTLDLEDETVNRLFFNGQTRYLHAYPLVGGQRAVPMPRSLAVEKTSTEPSQIYDRSVATPSDVTLRSISGFLQVDGGRLVCHTVDMAVNIHNQRDRPRGRGVEGQGAVFRYEAIAPMQTFVAAIICDHDADATELQKLLPERLWLGGSRSAGYGETTIDHVTVVDDWREWDAGAFAHTSKLPASAGKQRLTITLTSDLFVRDAHGAASATPPLAQIAAALCVQSVALDATRSTVATVNHGGFNRTWGLPTPQFAALAAGSVLVFNLDQAPTAAALTDLEQRGLGNRRAEGFGRVICNMLPAHAEYAVGKPDSSYPEETIALDPTSQQLAVLMAQRLLDQKLEAYLIAQVECNQINDKSTISNTQLSRLRIIARRALGTETMDTLDQFLKNLPSNARDQFARATIVGKGGGQPKKLDTWLRERIAQPVSLTHQSVHVAGQTAQADEQIAVDFTLRLIIAMARLKVKKEEQHD